MLQFAIGFALGFGVAAMIVGFGILFFVAMGQDK